MFVNQFYLNIVIFFTRIYLLLILLKLLCQRNRSKFQMLDRVGLYLTVAVGVIKLVPHLI